MGDQAFARSGAVGCCAPGAEKTVILPRGHRYDTMALTLNITRMRDSASAFRISRFPPGDPQSAVLFFRNTWCSKEQT
jgi:hypothetical protein